MTHVRFLITGLFFTFSFLFLSNPVKASIVVVNGLSHLYEVVPGETYRGVIEIQNTKDTDQAVKLYQRDYHFVYTGESYYEEPGTIERSNAKWIDVSPSYLVLKPKEKKLIAYEIKVPSMIPLTGTFWSVIMVETEAPIDTDKLQSGLTIQTQLRYAIQIATTLGKTGERNLTFNNANVVKEDGQRMLAVDIENKGDFLFKPDVNVELYDQEGNPVGVLKTTRKKLYPKTSARFLFEMKDIPAGTYQALILADCGESDVFGINLTVEVTDD